MDCTLRVLYSGYIYILRNSGTQIKWRTVNIVHYSKYGVNFAHSLWLWAGGCSRGVDLLVLSVDGVKGLVSVDHRTKHHRLQGGWRCYRDTHPRTRKH